jgi:tRNA-dihydrouridine synthase
VKAIIIMNQNFWQKLKKPFTILAPMANVTDWAFRQVIIETGTSTGLSVNRPDVFFTEFISADGICAAGKDKFKGELYFEENERPIVVQFFSANPEHMYRCAQLAQELGFDGIDINMGCPDKSVEKQGAGAALMKNPELAKKIIEETIRGAHSTSSGQAGLPVSVKTRLGFNSIDHDWIKHLLDTDITALTIHARTRKEMSKVPAHWDELGKIVEIASEIHGGPSTSSGRLSTKPLIIGNGDVANMDDVKEKAKIYNLDGVMVGRGIFDNPWFFSGKEVNDSKERINLLLKHLNNFEKLWLSGESGKNFDVMKRFFKVYINGYPGAKELRASLMSTKNKEQAVDLLLGEVW